MRIFLMADNWIGLKVTEYLASKNENIVGLAVHPQGYQNYTDEIVRESGLPHEDVFTGAKLLDDSFIQKVTILKPDIILVVFWRYILPENFFSIAPKGAVNFHMSYLPYNRGKNPNVWPIIEGTPAGVCMHYIDPGIDTGRIISRVKVPVKMSDTGKSLYKKQLIAFEKMFIETWGKLKSDKIIPLQQEDDKSTYHTSKDFDALKEINLDKEYKALDIINILRSKTFEPHEPAYFIQNGRKFFISVTLEEEK